MSNVDSLVEGLKELARAVETVISNYKRDGPSRKHEASYYAERLRRLEIAWKAFEEEDSNIRSLPEVAPSHEYFTSQFYETTKSNYLRFQQHFRDQLLAKKQLELPPVGPSPETPKPHLDSDVKDPAAEASTPMGAGIVRMLRRYKAMADSLRRAVDRLKQSEATRAWCKAKIVMVQRGWQQLDELHQQIFELCDDPEAHGFSMQQHIQLEEIAQNWVIQLESRLEELDATPISPAPPVTAPGVPLPKITLPSFDGSYLRWRQFRDLFLQMVHNNPMSKCQKLWYLKANLTGEAELLIRNFTLSDDNYDAAWRTLNERFDNRRLLVSALINKLMSQPSHAGGKPSVAAIKALHDTTQECLRGLENLQVSTSDWDPLLLHVLLRRLDSATHALYEQSLSSPRELPPLKDFLDFLEVRFQALETLGDKPTQPDTTRRKGIKTTVAAATAPRCLMCGQDHPLYYCPEFLRISTSKRLSFVRSKKLCINCLREGHQACSCTARNCRECTKNHNTLLQATVDNKSKSAKTISSSPTMSRQDSRPQSDPPSLSLTTLMEPRSKGYTLLSTAVVRLVGSHGRATDCRAVLDPGSQINLVTARIIKKLGLSSTPHLALIERVGGSTKKAHHRVNLGLRSKLTGYATQLEAYVMDKIISPQPSQNLNVSGWHIPKNIKLADPEFHRTEHIDMLLSAEHFYEVLAIGQIKLGPELPVLQNTLLGWIVAGRVVTPQESPVTCGVLTEDVQLKQLIKRFWEVEEVQDPQHKLTLTERACEAHFNQTMTRRSDGRFMVRLPFSDDPETLGDSQVVAIRRFIALERRLNKHPDLRFPYEEFMKEYARLGHMQEVTLQQREELRYYLPHHCVLKPDSSRTKLRVVFDASSKTTTSVSLNDVLHTGPTVQDDLFAILLRFRMPRFVFTADIEKMYRQIILHPEDRRYHGLIWRNGSSQPLRYYQLKTVTYGTTCAPYLATKCLQFLAQENQQRSPLGSSALQKDFYVDDVMTGADSLKEALRQQTELRTILSSAGMHLRKWCANHPQLLKQIKPEDQQVQLDFSSLSEDYIKTLGVIWRPKADEFQIQINLEPIKTRFSNRTIASDVARMFDPLGILAPVILAAKLFLQELWRLELDWDAALPARIHTQWSDFRSSLPSLKQARFVRHVSAGEKPVQVQLHTFCDASEKAYGAAVYVRSTLRSGQIMVKLLCAKSRVAPIKTITIPRLELCAAKLGAELTKRIKAALNLPEVFHVFWTDAEIVLAWVNSTASSYNTFVANRVLAIQTISRPDQWRHVASEDNPADILSRGMAPAELSNCSMWLQGPQFLCKAESFWPPEYQSREPCDLEKRRIRVAMVAIADSEVHFIQEIQHGNSFRRLQRIVAYMMRFVGHLKPMAKRSQLANQALTSDELAVALEIILRYVQSEVFNNEILDIRSGKQVSKHSPLVGLAPFLDPEGIIRVGGRLEAAKISFNAKHPILLPLKHPFTRLLMMDIHRKNCHLGAQALLASTRQRFWPIRGKQLARSIVQRCVWCTRVKPKLFSQIMGNLPSARVQPARPFINSGVDFCGPMMLHYRGRGTRPQKGYLAIFCCFATKAIHLELVSDLSTETFICALKRFIGRRGHCRNLFCDNATNFVGAHNQLAELSSALYSNEARREVTAACAARGIDFHFIPPRAPHFGGLWEAAVKSAKNLIRRGVSSATLTYEELHTLVVEVEAILNSRPLIPMSEDPNDLTALTPAHFLIGEPLTAMVDGRSEPFTGGLHARWKLINHIKFEFWRRWSHEYLTQLQHRVKWRQANYDVTPGTVVIISEDNTPSMKWPLGRVIKVYKGADGFVRVTDVKTASGIFKRPIHKLAPLPVLEDPPAAEEPSQTSISRSTGGLVRVNNDSNAATKRRPMRTGTSSVALLLTCLLIPMVNTVPTQGSATSPGPGLYFQSLGKTYLSSSEWKLLIYYSLQPYWWELAVLQNGTNLLQQLCERGTLQTNCLHLVDHLRHFDKELSDINRIRRIRSKRGAINAVGGIARSLFGTLDDEYANQMVQTIKTMEGRQDMLHSLLKNQTSIIDSTLNILGKSEKTIHKRFTAIEQKLAQMANEATASHPERSQTQTLDLITTLLFEMTLVTFNLQRVQSSLVSLVTDTQHGQFNSLLLSQQQLSTELTNIREHLSENQRLLIDRENFSQLFQITSIRAKVTADFVVFELKVPLVTTTTFELYRLFPMPAVKRNRLVAVLPTSPYLIITPHRDLYYPLSELEHASCIRMEQTVHICRQSHPLYSKESNVSGCEVLLLKGTPSTSECNMVNLPTSFVLSNIPQSNEWIYAFTNQIIAQLVCKGNTSTLMLQGSGTLRLEPDCILKSDVAIIQGHHMYEGQIGTAHSAVRRWWTEIGGALEGGRQESGNARNSSSQLGMRTSEISELRRQLQTQDLTWPNQLTTHDIHQYSIGYLGIIGLAILIGYLSCRPCKLRCNARSNPPVPLPRRHSLPHTLEEVERSVQRGGGC